MKNISLGTKILIGLVAGALLGLLLGEQASILKPFGDLFILTIKIVVIPLVFASITNGVIAASDIKSIGRIGIKTVILFLGTSAFSVSIGLALAWFIQPGKSIDISVNTAGFNVPEPQGIMQTLLSMVPANPFASLAEGNILQIIVFALLLGISVLLAGPKGKPMADLFDSLTETMFKMVNIIIKTAPYGVFCLIAPTTGKYGISVLLPLVNVILATVGAFFLLVVLVYLPMIKFIGKTKISVFFKHTSETILMAFSTAVSSATFPFSIEAQKNMKVSKKVRSFVIPLGMTMNMNGTSIYLAVSAIFIANAYGITLTFHQMAMIVLSGVLASVGTAAVPMAGFVMLTMVLQTVGLPLEGLALVAGIDRILDMMRTAGNIAGDNVVCLAVAAMEGEIGVEDEEDDEESAQHEPGASVAKSKKQTSPMILDVVDTNAAAMGPSI